MSANTVSTSLLKSLPPKEYRTGEERHEEELK